MADLVLDVGTLADLLTQCFQSNDWTKPWVQPSQFISRENSRQINGIVWKYKPHVVVASAMAFVELARKWDEIVDGRFQPYQLAIFLQDPPDWFVVEPVDEYLVLLLGQVPLVRELEWPDATHIATALSRERGSLITTDCKLKRAVELLQGH
jgi:predicted nucleic acid-binding protein